MACYNAGLPVAIITYEGATQSHVLHVVAEEGDSAPTFTCSVDGSHVRDLSWGGMNRGTALPSEVSLVPRRQNLALTWHRALEYTDSGNYTCNATSDAGASSVRLELLVRRKYYYTDFPFLPPVFSS